MFVNGMASTNPAESFWPRLKRGINGIYHHVSAKHLQKYCDEYSYCWNTKDMTDGERFEDWFSNSNGKRLIYRSLINKPWCPQLGRFDAKQDFVGMNLLS